MAAQLIFRLRGICNTAWNNFIKGAIKWGFVGRILDFSYDLLVDTNVLTACSIRLFLRLGNFGVALL